MSDFAQMLVVIDVAEGDAEAIAARLRGAMLANRLIDERPSDCGLGGPAFAPGENAASVLEDRPWTCPAMG